MNNTDDEYDLSWLYKPIFYEIPSLYSIGRGGQGAQGARVVVHTNFPEVLSVVEVDVSGGKAGTNGDAGLVGTGGTAGEHLC